MTRAQQADLLYHLNLNLMKWHRSYWHVSQYEVTLPKWQSGQGVGLVTWRSWVQSPAEPYFFYFFLTWKKAEMRLVRAGACSYANFTHLKWNFIMRTIMYQKRDQVGEKTDHFKRYLPKIYFIRKNFEVWKFFFSMLKKFFFSIFFS